MRLFHVSDILSITSGILVSTRHMEGVYDILNFLTSDSLFTRQLPCARQECLPWLKAQFPNLMEDAPEMQARMKRLSADCGAANGDKSKVESICNSWWKSICEDFHLPEMIPVHELGADMHVRIDAFEELAAMKGDANVIAVTSGGNQR